MIGGIGTTEKKPLMDLATKARKLVEENRTPEFCSRVVSIYMEHNGHCVGGNMLPLDVAIELAAVELGIIDLGETAHED